MGGPFQDDVGDGAAQETSSSVQRRSKMPWIAAVGVVLTAGAAGLWLGIRQRQAPDRGFEDVGTTAEEVSQQAEELWSDKELVPGDLYFPGAGGRLYSERRDLPAGTPDERARVLVEGLLLGPAEGAASGLRAPLPPGTRVETVYLLGTTALLDLRPPKTEKDGSERPLTPAEARQRRLSYGSQQELLALYSLVNTVVLGVEGVDAVQILWDGRQPETFAGHVDTTHPVAADPGYLAAQ